MQGGSAARAMATNAAMKVGELAKRTGVSVRTLHYYEEIGLLTPSGRSQAGHRLYGADDIVRLQQIRSLRQLGFSLDEIGDCLRRPDFSPLHVIELHMTQLSEQIALQSQLRDRLAAIAITLRSSGQPPVEDLMQLLEMMSMFEKYYTPEQLKELEERRQTLGDEKIRQSEVEWQELIEQVCAEMEKGTDPADERVQTLAQRWMGLVNAFTGGNPGIEKALGNMWTQEKSIHGIETAPMRQMGEYISRALASKQAE